MSSGTKIGLAVIAIVLGVLVVYYGLLPGADDGAPLLVETDELGASAAPEPEPQTKPAPAVHRIENGAPLPAGAAKRVEEASPPVREPGLTRAPGAAPDARSSGAAPPAGEPEKGGFVSALSTADVAPAGGPDGGGSLPEAPAHVPYVVKDGDTMTSIAEMWFGDRSRWEQIAKLNLVDPNRLRAGDVLRLPPRDGAAPANGASGSGAPPAGAEITYVVQSGDTLSSIAKAYYGSAEQWRVIHDANRDVIGASPDALEVGWKLRIPPAPKAAQ
jgi:nucleoid-associated protein YgaU